MSDPALRQDIACPFCGLVCDDLAIEAKADRLILRRGACPINKAHFERPFRHASPRAAGAACAREQAVGVAARILAEARLPVFAGLGADIDAVRGALDLADRTGGVIDHAGSQALFGDLTALRDTGTIATTLSEVRNRADVLLIVGPDPLPLFPRFLERCYPAGPTLFDDGGRARRLIRLGPPSANAAPLPPGIEFRLVALAADELPAALSRLRLLLRGRNAGRGSAQLVEVSDALKGARYAVIAWAASLLPPDSADLVAITLADILRDLNRTRRAAALPLGGSENLAGAHQACLWQTGFPLRTGFGPRGPWHDPELLSARRLIESGEADTLVWISALNGAAPPPLPPELPLILLADPAVEPPGEPAVFLPVGRPGIDHAGQVFRLDGVVALSLATLHEGGPPSAAATLAAIGEALERIKA